MKILFLAIFAIVPLILAQRPPSDHLKSCLSEVEDVKKLIQAHTPSKSGDSENVQRKIEDYIYKFLSDRVMQTQSELTNSLMNLMFKASTAGGDDGNQAYQLLYDIQTNVGNEITTVQDRQNTYFRNRLNRVTPLAENASSKYAHDYAVEKLTAINTEGESLCRNYDAYFSSLLGISNDMTKAFENPARTQSYTDIVKSKGKFVYDKFNDQSDMDMYSYFSNLCSYVSSDATTDDLRKKLDDGWQTIEKKFGEKVDALQAKLSQDGDERKSLIDKYANIPEDQKSAWKKVVDGAVTDGSNALEAEKMSLTAVKENCLNDFDRATALMPDLTTNQYNTCNYEYNDSRMVYAIIGFDTNWKLNTIYQQLNQFTEAPPMV